MERLQKILAQAGVASRRKAEELILEGRVSVDGQVITELGAKADMANQRVEVDGRPISMEQTVNLILNKPTSYVTTVKDPEGRRTVMDLLSGVEERVYPVGRLDYETSGLLLLSNDGELTHRLLHPSHHIEKVYRVTVLGMPDKKAIEMLKDGVPLEDGMTSPAILTVLRHHPVESVLEITIHEGRNRQIRRMFEHVGYPVKRLKRMQFGPLALGNLKTGEHRKLTAEEWRQLYTSADLAPPLYPAEPVVRDRKPSRSRANDSHGGRQRTKAYGGRGVSTDRQRTSGKVNRRTGGKH